MLIISDLRNLFHVKRKHYIARHIVPRETFAAVDELMENYQDVLEKYLDELFWWNKRINLVSRDVSRGTLWEHIRHSLLLSQFEIYQNAQTIVDAGTGGGLPGIPLAMVSPEKHFILNDIATKKVLAVKQIVQKLGLQNAETVDGSVEELEPGEPFLLVSKHAFKIDELWDMIKDKKWASLVLYKGIDFEDEVEEIDEPLAVESYDLSGNSEFYRGKSLIIVNRK